MKCIIIVLTLTLFTGCKTKKLEIDKAADEAVYSQIDTMDFNNALPEIIAKIDCDTLENLCNDLVAALVKIKTDSVQLKKSADTLAARLLHARLIISNVKYYLNICIKNPSQDKFLKGWIRRAVE